MDKHEHKGHEYFERGLDRIIDRMKYIHSFSLDLRQQRIKFQDEGIFKIIGMRRDLLNLGLELIEEIGYLEGEELVWKKYERVHKMQETINWLYSDCMEAERVELIKVGFERFRDPKTGDIANIQDL